MNCCWSTCEVCFGRRGSVFTAVASSPTAARAPVRCVMRGGWGRGSVSIAVAAYLPAARAPAGFVLRGVSINCSGTLLAAQAPARCFMECVSVKCSGLVACCSSAYEVFSSATNRRIPILHRAAYGRQLDPFKGSISRWCASFKRLWLSFMGCSV